MVPWVCVADIVVNALTRLLPAPPDNEWNAYGAVPPLPLIETKVFWPMIGDTGFVVIAHASAGGVMPDGNTVTLREHCVLVPRASSTATVSCTIWLVVLLLL